MTQSNPTALLEAIREIEEDYEQVCQRVERARVQMLRDNTLGRYGEGYLSAIQREGGSLITPLFPRAIYN